jgi:hypothetical protein
LAASTSIQRLWTNAGVLGHDPSSSSTDRGARSHEPGRAAALGREIACRWAVVPVSADVPSIDVVFVGEPDPLTGIGTKGVGEIGLPGIGAAIANAVYHATGRRIRSLPITIDQLL